MFRTPTLDPRPLRLEVQPLARLHADGRVELLGPSFPPRGALTLVLWRPEREPAFAAVAGHLGPGWRFEGPPAEGWVVLWIPGP